MAGGKLGGSGEITFQKDQVGITEYSVDPAFDLIGVNVPLATTHETITGSPSSYQAGLTALGINIEVSIPADFSELTISATVVGYGYEVGIINDPVSGISLGGDWLTDLAPVSFGGAFGPYRAEWSLGVSSGDDGWTVTEQSILGNDVYTTEGTYFGQDFWSQIGVGTSQGNTADISYGDPYNPSTSYTPGGGSTGVFDPPGTWTGGAGIGTPDPGLPVNPDYVGIQPLILDLDGDGVEVSFGENIFFDWDNDGYLEQTSWAAPDDGFLVIDLDADGTRGAGDGVIDQARELAFALWGNDGDTDLQALGRAFDSNNDGVLNDQDGVWNELRIWQDLNQNGFAPGKRNCGNRPTV